MARSRRTGQSGHCDAHHEFRGCRQRMPGRLELEGPDHWLPAVRGCIRRVFPRGSRCLRGKSGRHCPRIARFRYRLAAARLRSTVASLDTSVCTGSGTAWRKRRLNGQAAIRHRFPKLRQGPVARWHQQPCRQVARGISSGGGRGRRPQPDTGGGTNELGGAVRCPVHAIGGRT